MTSCVIFFDGRVNKVNYDDTHQWLLGYCLKFSQIAVVMFKNSFRN